MTATFLNKTCILSILIIATALSCSEKDEGLLPEPGEETKSFTEILGRPSNSSVTMSILFDMPTEVYWEYGTLPGIFGIKSSTYEAKKDNPLEVDFPDLSPNTKYYYRTRYRQMGTTSSFLAGEEHYFRTQRSPGSTFTFTVESDPHPYDKKGSHSLWSVALQNQLYDNADFMIDLGDTFGDDHNPYTISSDEVRELQLNCRRFFGEVCHSMPLYFCLGNHEGEKGYYLLKNPPGNLAVYETTWRKYYYPNPFPDTFYSGNAETEGYGISMAENYYSWVWGDALFVVLDVYRYGTADEKPGGWDFTLGKEQYDWLKKTLETSTSKYKFVFAHHVRGEGRGGVANARYYEWGGYEADGTTYTFSSRRSGWQKPIQKLFDDNGVDIFFQGHDHLFSREVLEGVTYQEVPMPSDSTYQIGVLANADAYISDVVGGSGHIRVTVSSSGVKVDFVKAFLPADENASRKNGSVAFSYTVN